MLGYDVPLGGPVTRRTALRFKNVQAGASRAIEPMSTYRLKDLLSPRSVALVGGSPRQGSVERAILGNIHKAAQNPLPEESGGRRAKQKVADGRLLTATKGDRNHMRPASCGRVGSNQHAR